MTARIRALLDDPHYWHGVLVGIVIDVVAWQLLIA